MRRMLINLGITGGLAAAVAASCLVTGPPPPLDTSAVRQVPRSCSDQHGELIEPVHIKRSRVWLIERNIFGTQ